MGKQGDFTAREREIRKVLFAVLHERDWQLSNTLHGDEITDGRWQFADAVIDKLREQRRHG